MSEQALVHSLLSDLREALVFQRELGLGALDVDDKLLRPKKSRPAQSAQRTVALDAGVSTPEQAREELARMLKGERGQTPSKDPGAGAALKGAPEGSSHTRASQLDAAQSNLVLGAGNPNARLMFVGEAPRRDVELLGEPFAGNGGELLTKMLQAMGLERADVYLTNVVKRRRSRQNTSPPSSMDACEPILRQQIEAIRPEVIVTFGNFASEMLLRDEAPVSKMRGQWCEYQGIAVMPTFHPDELLQDASKKKPVWMDLQAVMHRLGIKRPA
jgi:DNA polymerase